MRLRPLSLSGCWWRGRTKRGKGRERCIPGRGVSVRRSDAFSERRRLLLGHSPLEYRVWARNSRRACSSVQLGRHRRPRGGDDCRRRAHWPDRSGHALHCLRVLSRSSRSYLRGSCRRADGFPSKPDPEHVEPSSERRTRWLLAAVRTGTAVSLVRVCSPVELDRRGFDRDNLRSVPLHGSRAIVERIEGFTGEPSSST
jgi:hypothetical protein